jgi:hypothetical protein
MPFQTRHGYARWQNKTPEYRIWEGARNRCRNPNNRSFARYGGRGITFHPAFDDFAVFFKEIGPRPSPQHSLDRIKNERGYEPGNIRWATHAEQFWNSRPGPHRKLTPDLVRAIMVDTRRPADIARAFGCSPQTICDIRKGRIWRSVSLPADG